MKAPARGAMGFHEQMVEKIRGRREKKNRNHLAFLRFIEESATRGWWCRGGSGGGGGARW